MEQKFDEGVFLYALSARLEDARRFSQIFRPSWLRNASYVPILEEIYLFTKTHGIPPSLNTLGKIFEERDPSSYELRYSKILGDLAAKSPDTSEILHTLDKARDAAVVHSFQEMEAEQSFLHAQRDYEGKAVLESVNRWLQQFVGLADERAMNLKEAVDHLIETRGFMWTDAKIPCGIAPIDQWTGGGLKRKQLGIIMGPSGHGKSFCCIYMSHYMAAVEEKNILVVTNEESIEDNAARYLSRMTGEKMEVISEDPILGRSKLGRFWKTGLGGRLRIAEINREASMDEIESEVVRWSQISGWKPDVVFIDYMGRMRPNLTGYNRDQSWSWMGAIAQDFVRFAKRHSCLVWTFAQANRSGMNRNLPELDMTAAAGSTEHFREAVAVISVRRVTLADDDSTMALEFRSLKQRHSRQSDQSVILRANLDRMSITNEEIDKERVLRGEGGTTWKRTK